MARFTHHVFVCLNERPPGDPRGSCSERGGEAIFKALKLAVAQARLPDVRVNRAGCLDHCAHGPSVVVYPEAAWYRLASPADAQCVVRQHLAGGAPVQALLMDDTQPIAPSPSLATEPTGDHP